ncbi:S1 RNA-binding domain-containing protein 1 [Catharus ustulatus]|uniref:S1 RNA-binding domain-containing protein 1 n=1 Tax=Catharus ustulatus TaxID=91951 RepID=UPI00140E0379|nr:S1 RNA-binding domain-containing protein 1 [Catharus ustulatus]XP_032912610.1 S1 RNA-binding domain-containing protein 1 [Catharus ustulatus]XP_032912611.1 S1 RNA-binding domain-containing protein 1 [Catharus ustulatus]XP_032912612.1 S1 RNA-binding domain-containing protein 1 [Catharus ustulatus]
MSSQPRRVKSVAKAPKSEELPSFLNSTSESEEEEEEAWEPKSKIARKPRLPKKTEAKTKKAAAPRSTVARKMVKKVAIKEEMDVSLPIAPVEDNKMQLLKPKEENADTKSKSLNRVPEVPKKIEINSFQGQNQNSLMSNEKPSTSVPVVKQEKCEEEFAFDEPPSKKIKLNASPEGKPVKKLGGKIKEEFEMNWDIVQALSEITNVEPWVCANLLRLFQEENTIPFIARYRKELINNLEADALREVQHALEELRTVARKTHTMIQKLKKEGKLSTSLLNGLLNCRTLEELDHVSAPYKTGSKGTKAQRAKQLGLEPAALSLLQNPVELNLFSYIRPNTKGLENIQEVEAGVQHILADIFAKDKDTLDFIRKLCQQRYISIQSTLAKVSSKSGNEKDIDKFQLYHEFSCNIKNIQHHQILAINRGENLKILTVKVNIPDGVKNEFCWWCVNERWKPKQFLKPEFMRLFRSSVEDAYKRLIYPLLCREFRSKLTSDAEKESVMMFGRNLRQLLLTSPVRGRALMGVDPGYKHGCKLAIISPTSQILHTDVVYLHSGQGFREAEKIKRLLLQYNCSTVVIGNGTACRETEAYFADLIMKKYFAPLDVVYCIANEAGASIYSVSPEASKEMPDLDPNLRSAVSIARRVQDPLAELVKIEPKHLGVGMYQHDVSQTLLKATLDSVVEECVSFVGVDINICSEILLRHIAGLNVNRAKNIIEWREKNGPFINREQLKEVKGLGPKTFQQCAGFIRFNQEYIKTFCSNKKNELGSRALLTKAGTLAKKKSKLTSCASQQPNPLDQTCIHPESYNIAMRFLSLIGGNANDIGKSDMQQKVNVVIQKEGLEGTAKRLNTTVHTLQLIIDGLTQPEGYDIRTDFDKPDFKRSIVCFEDLSAGAILTGKVENATPFGVFVDIGVGKAGLIPVRNITEAKLSKVKKRRSLGLGPGERVEVKVLNVDIPRLRITLDLIRVL